MARRSGLLALKLLAAAAGLALAVLAAAGDSTPPAPDPLLGKIQENKTDLDALRREIAAQKEKIASLDAQAAAMKRDTGQILREIELSRELLGGLDERERLLAAQSRDVSAQLESSLAAYQARRRALASSLRSMYIRGRDRELELILTSGSFSEFHARLQWESQLVRLGAGMMDKTRSEGERILREQRSLEVSLAEIALAREEAALESDRLEELEAERIASLRTLESQKKGIRNRMLELSLNEQRLTYILDDLEQQRIENAARESAAAGTLTELAGRLEWPVTGTVIRDFGRSVHPRFKTVTLNNGLNIVAAYRSPVAAVADGTVEFADDLPGFGQCVIVDHGEGYYTLYAYLDQAFVTPGGEISRGQVIAEVGRPTGSGQAQLYFEVRHGRTPLDPADWLQPR